MFISSDNADRFLKLASTRGCTVSVGSEEARCCASLRPPLKLYVPISGIQLSRRRSGTRVRTKRGYQRDEVHQAKLFIQLRLGQLYPTPGPPPAESVRPNAPHDPAVEFVEERSNVGSFVILSPTSQGRI